MPQPSDFQQCQALGTNKRRKTTPIAEVTELREGGYHLGNDLHTVAAVWELKEKITELKEAKGHIHEGLCFCHHACYTREQRKVQDRLKCRRRLLWKTIEQAADKHQMDAKEIVRFLDEQKNSAKDRFGSPSPLGISRVEDWAQESLNRIRKGEDSDILTVCKEYVLKKSRNNASVTA